MDPADAAHAVRRHEFALAQQPLQNARQHRMVDERQEMLAAFVLPVGTSTNVAPLKFASAVIAQQCAEARHGRKQPLIDHFGREERDQAHQRIDIDPVRLSVGVDDQVLEEPRLRVPQRDTTIDMSCDGIGDRQELREGLDGDALVIGIFGRELEGHHRHVEGEHRHPAGCVRLLQAEARRQRLRAVEDGDVVETEKAALEDVVPVPVLAVDPPGIVQQELLVDPPGIVQQELLKDTVQEMKVTGAALYPLGAEDLERRRRVNWWIYVTEGPFIVRDLAVRMQITLAQYDFDLIFGEVDIDERQRAAMKREIPGG